MYLYPVMLISFLVDLLLLLAANRLTGCPPALGRCLLAAMAGGVYSGACMLPALGSLGSTVCRMAVLGLLGAVAFGPNRRGISRCALFVFLNLALEGAAAGLGKDGLWPVLAAVAAVLGLCAAVFYTGRPGQELVEVELSRGEKHTAMLALRDTGNTLKDPVTGQSVLITDHRSAETLLGLTREQLHSPVETVASCVIPGLRLIPYRAVGQRSGMLVAIRLNRVRIGTWKGSALVAFAPEGLGESGTYRALTGGSL